MNYNKILSLALLITIAASGCKKASSTTDAASEDSSVSGSAASSVGGAIAASDSNGTVASYEARKSGSIWSVLLQQPAYASGACPKITTANGSGCANGGNYVDLTYNACSFGSSAATWTGTLEVTLTGGLSCGTFPSPANKNLFRQFVSTANTPGTGSRTSAAGTVVTIDHASANLSNFDNQTIATTVNSGYGTAVTFNGTGARTNVVVKQRVYVTNGRDHSIDGSINIAESGTTRTASGSVKVYHNKMKVVGTSTFNNVVYNNTSCVPVSGSISTVFAAGTNVTTPTQLGQLLVGKSETMTFNSDGTATIVNADGSSATVTLSHCY